ncbi:hypothetical protein ABW19_dt0203474 [Dactylella cylindrospora]|nr:hypothetical protein ABW19_dt0203474 [Dactylella cylindrospora]
MTICILFRKHSNYNQLFQTIIYPKKQKLYRILRECFHCPGPCPDEFGANRKDILINRNASKCGQDVFAYAALSGRLRLFQKNGMTWLHTHVRVRVSCRLQVADCGCDC